MIKRKQKQIIAMLLVIIIGISAFGFYQADAENEEFYPYVLFAANEEASVKIDCGSLSVNGDSFANGTFDLNAVYSNINGKVESHSAGSATDAVSESTSDGSDNSFPDTENNKQEMIYIFDRLETLYFSENTVTCYEDYSNTELNQNLNESLFVNGTASLTGNVSASRAVGALSDISISGQSVNCNNALLYSKYGDINITAENAAVNGLIYAPFGTVTINGGNFSLNGIIIADRIVINGGCVNINYSASVAAMVGTESEEPYIGMDEWSYLPDSDGDDIPDFVENQIGTDPQNADTDGDGLPDCYEMLYLATDPTLPDTDRNGVPDGDEDLDGGRAQ